MAATQQDVIEAFARQDRPYGTLENILTEAKATTGNDEDARGITMAVCRVATLQPDAQRIYIDWLLQDLSGAPAVRDLVERQTQSMAEVDNRAMSSAYALLEDTADLMEHIPPDHRLAQPVREDIAETRRRAAATVAGTMMFQTLLSGTEKDAYVERIARAVPERNATMRKIVKLVGAVMKMGTWSKRPMGDQEVVRELHRAEERLGNTSVLRQRPGTEQSAREVEDNLLMRRVAAHANNVVTARAGIDEPIERDMIRLWLETGENRPRH